MTNQDKCPVTGTHHAASKFPRHLFTAICLSVAAAQGAYAMAILGSTLLALAPSPTGNRDVAAFGVQFANLPAPPPLKAKKSTRKSARGAQASNGRDHGDIADSQHTFIWTIPADTPGPTREEILRAALEEQELAHSTPDTVKENVAGVADSAAMVLTGLGFAMAGFLGRSPNRKRSPSRRGTASGIRARRVS